MPDHVCSRSMGRAVTDHTARGLRRVRLTKPPAGTSWNAAIPRGKRSRSEYRFGASLSLYMVLLHRGRNRTLN